MSSDTEIRPFQIDMPEGAVTDLRRRIDAMVDVEVAHAATVSCRLSAKPS